jgi:hypothetical protein
MSDPEPTTTYKLNTYDPVPTDKANVRILLVSGQKTDFLVTPSDTIEQFCQLVFDQWPAGITI